MNPGIYTHSKTGNLYKVHFVAKHSETLEELVVYEALYDNKESKYWVRPLLDFQKEVEINGKKVPRFVFVNPVRNRTPDANEVVKKTNLTIFLSSVKNKSKNKASAISNGVK